KLMNKVILILFGFLTNANLFAQHNIRPIDKPPIDTSLLGKWPVLSRPALSNDGNYLYYTIFNQPVKSGTLIIQSTNNHWKKEIIGASALFFTNDSKQVVFKRIDTLSFLTAVTDQ